MLLSAMSHSVHVIYTFSAAAMMRKEHGEGQSAAIYGTDGIDILHTAISLTCCPV
jgi:hypothetical protein